MIKMKQTRQGIVKELETVVKQRSPQRKGAHVTLPYSMREKHVTITLLDGTGFLKTWARRSGNSAHAFVSASWVGKRVMVRVDDTPEGPQDKAFDSYENLSFTHKSV